MSDPKQAAPHSPTPAQTRQTGSRLRLGQKFSLAVTTLMILAMCVFWLLTNQTTENILRQQADGLGNTLARQTAILVTELVLANDLVSMNVLLNQLTREDAIAQVAVLSIDDQVIAIAGTSVNPTGNEPTQRSDLFGSYVAPIALQDSLAGYVRVNLDQRYIEQGVTRNFMFMLTALFLLILAGISVFYAMIQHLVGFPLQMLTGAIQSTRHGEPVLSPFDERGDEVGATIRQYNRLLEDLQDDETRQLIFGPEPEPDPVASAAALYRRPGSAFVSILYISISNYRAALHQMEADETIELLNTYYFYIHKVARLYNGNIEKCAGDEILITFGAAQADDDHCFHAVCAALLFLEITATLARELEAQELPSLQFRAGLHCGELLTGVLSSLEQNSYTVAGENLALTRVICGEAPVDTLIISEAAYTLADAEGRLVTEAFTDVADATQGEFIRTWLVEEARHTYKALLERQVEHLLAEEVIL